MITVSITLTLAGVDTGPTFDLFSNVDSYAVAFETGVDKASLEAGYISTIVPDGTTTIRVYSAGTCETYVDLNVITSTTTTTSTTSTTTTISPTTTTTTTAYVPPTITSITVQDAYSSAVPVTCEGTIPPTEGTTTYYRTSVILLDNFGNPIAATSNIDVVIEYSFQPCYGGPPTPTTPTITILAGNSSASQDYTYSTLVDCGSSNCEPEGTTYVGPVSNTAGLPFV